MLYFEILKRFSDSERCKEKELINDCMKKTSVFQRKRMHIYYTTKNN